MRYRTDEAWQFTRFKVKFLFVMRIDKPELFVKNPIVGSAEKFLEGRCQFLKVSLSVFVSLLYTFGCVLDSFSKKILEKNKDINNNCILSEK